MNIFEIDSELLLINYSIYGDLKGVRKMIEAGTDYNTPSKKSFPLYEATAKGHIHVVDYLLSLDRIAVNEIDKETGYSPLHTALFYSFYSNSPKILDLFLLNPKVNLDIASKAPITFDFTPLHLAAYINYLEGAQSLIAAGANPNIKTKDGFSFLDVAGKSNSCREKPEQVQEKLKKLVVEKDKIFAGFQV
jgi:ankyrin repeat protein